MLKKYKRPIHFYKYSSNGNTFVLLDELHQVQIPETQKKQFSNYVCHETVGIGCDSLLILQKFDESVLRQIYLNKMNVNFNSVKKPDYIMRVYEKGMESNMCGNGLISIAHHLKNTHRVNAALIATEIPTNKPIFRKVLAKNNNTFRATLGIPCLPCDDFFQPLTQVISNARKSYYHLNLSLSIYIDGRVKQLTFNNCYMTFTGEPHLVLFRPSLFSDHKEQLFEDELFDILFYSAMTNQNLIRTNELIHQIGQQINALNNIFPKGVNVNFSEILPNKKIANRCFERGINKETYSCGTGATAVATLVNELGLLNSEKITILPWRARYEELYQDAEISISREGQIYSLCSSSQFLSQGEYYY